MNIFYQTLPQIEDIFQQESLLNFHHSHTTPALIILYISTILIFFIVGLWKALKENNKIGGFLIVLITSVSFSLLVLIILVIFPSITQWIVNLIR